LSKNYQKTQISSNVAICFMTLMSC